MKNNCKKLFLFVFLTALLFCTSILFANTDHQVNKDALKYVENFLNDAAARKDFSKNNPQAAEAEALLKTFPPATQKKIEAIMLLLLKTHGSDAAKFDHTLNKEGGNATFDLFSPEIKKEIQKLATDLEKNPQVLEKLMSNPTVQKAISDHKEN